ncbi:HlyD family secretion protein [Stakelama sp. CBK3Z-3]|uniref:HlyD family secretion protein n=1 Tax=Stakelama flava TaxID=2860338 RepID=A0ABS6XNM3_9SPHN|nr:HlyD family secretion protein [Stakelama flava]MBW4331809.1 HlyD family secretion protein [Stakelama flava]
MTDRNAEESAENPRETPDQDDAEREERPSPLKRRGVRIALLVGLIVIVVAGIFWFVRYKTVGQYMQATDDAYIQADAVVVSPKVGGYVQKVFVADHQQVKAGAPLVQIDPGDYRAKAAQVEAQIDVSRADARGAEAQIDEQRAAIAQAEAQLAQAKSAAAYANAEVARHAPLAKTGAESEEQLAKLRDQAHQADAQLASARAALVQAQRRIGTLRTQVEQAQAQGESSRAQLASANKDLKSTLIRASIDGRVGDKSVRVGQFVQPANRMMSIVPMRNLYITANFKETQLGLMRIGQPVEIEVDALPDVPLHGRVESFSPGTGAQFSILPPQNATGNFTKIVQRVPVRISVAAGPEARKLLLPGMSVSVTVDTRGARGADDRIAHEQEQYNDKAGVDE